MNARPAIPLALILACLFAACGGDGSDDPLRLVTPAADTSAKGAVEANRRHYDYFSKGQYVRMYADLHPAQQALVSEETFVRCQERGVSVAIDRVIETFPETLTVPGTDIRADSIAITMDVTASEGGANEKATLTVHEILVDGRWRWMDDPERYASC